MEWGKRGGEASRVRKEVTHPSDLVPSEAFVGPAAREIGESLRAAYGGLEFTALAGGGGILPDGSAGERECVRRELFG